VSDIEQNIRYAHLLYMTLSGSKRAILWLITSVFFCLAAGWTYQWAIDTEGNISIFLFPIIFALMFMGLFLNTVFVNSILGKSTSSDGLDDSDRLDHFIHIFERAGLKFAKGARNKIAEQTIEHFAKDELDMRLILDCCGGLIYKKHLFQRNMAAAHAGNEDELRAARQKLRPRPDRGVYSVRANHMVVFARLSPKSLIDLNSRLLRYGLAFEPI